VFRQVQKEYHIRTENVTGGYTGQKFTLLPPWREGKMP